MNRMNTRPQSSSQRSQAKLLASGKNNKRKLAPNAEEIRPNPTIVRQHESQPPTDRPPSSNIHRPTDKPPPSKRFRATTSLLHEPGPSASTSFGRTPEIEEDVRAMEDEADRLRREARTRNLDPALRQTSHTPARPPPRNLPVAGSHVWSTRHNLCLRFIQRVL
ncbi:hypothetical protein D9757_001834 [Collybiopsis confluens]|uniref:Uncharacterized protein n=1 Tax=Collybiopsis confluens TaxID=2823264 RepID=A0A8H5MEU2_9AGAR|nr:hypothetical protein D9757_001834 [Collybiopsis confluens]